MDILDNVAERIPILHNYYLKIICIFRKYFKLAAT